MFGQTGQPRVRIGAQAVAEVSARMQQLVFELISVVVFWMVCSPRSRINARTHTKPLWAKPRNISAPIMR